MRHGLTALALLIATPAFAGQLSYMSPKEVKAGPRLYGIDFGKAWVPVKGVDVPGAELTVKARYQDKCGSDTFVTIHNDYHNDFTNTARPDFFTRVKVEDVSPLLQRMFYPGGEVIEKTAPTLEPFGNVKAYTGKYRVNFADGRSYLMDYYLTYDAGYFIHVNGYAKPKDILLAESCFKDLFETFRLRDENGVMPPSPEDLKPKSKYFDN